MGKLIYCTRTVPEMTKCMHELKKVIAYRDAQLGTTDAVGFATGPAPPPGAAGGSAAGGSRGSSSLAAVPADQLAAVEANAAAAGGGSTFLALCLSSRRNMCIHPQVRARARRWRRRAQRRERACTTSSL